MYPIRRFKVHEIMIVVLYRKYDFTELSKNLARCIWK